MRKPSHNRYNTAHIHKYNIATHTQRFLFLYLQDIVLQIKGGVVDGEKKGGIHRISDPHLEGREIHQFTSASGAMVLANEEPLPLLLCADGLYGPLELGLDPLGLLPPGEGGVWGRTC